VTDESAVLLLHQTVRSSTDGKEGSCDVSFVGDCGGRFLEVNMKMVLGKDSGDVFIKHKGLTFILNTPF